MDLIYYFKGYKKYNYLKKKKYEYIYFKEKKKYIYFFLIILYLGSK